MASKLGLFISESLYFYDHSNQQITYASTTSAVSQKALGDTEFQQKIESEFAFRMEACRAGII
jgi:hypothetical protein